MTVESLRRSPLADRADDLAAASTPAVALAEIPFASAVNLRVDPDGPAAARVADVLGVALPTVPNTVALAGDRAVLWLGPDEWLVVGPDGDAPVRPLREALAGDRGSAVDVSANRTTIRLRGPKARDLLEKGCTIDLHPRVFASGQCAQTWLARAQIVLWQVDDEPEYRLLVRGSFAHYLCDWLIDAAGEYAESWSEP